MAEDDDLVNIRTEEEEAEERRLRKNLEAKGKQEEKRRSENGEDDHLLDDGDEREEEPKVGEKRKSSSSSSLHIDDPELPPPTRHYLSALRADSSSLSSKDGIPAAFPRKKIKRLDEAVVNRIAAGEVILRPANALKEMIENSLDAGASTISVLVKGGGLKLLQIQDNGHGIEKEDLPIVCERFTTSKLTKFEDLRTIQTFGFRGEALASISFVAHVSITSMVANSLCAFKAHYQSGKLVPERTGETEDPKPCAGVKGTSIVVEDLFYNMIARKNALRNPSEEFSRIADVVTKYALHSAPKVGFSLKKVGESTADVHTTSSSSPNASKLDAVKSLYGSQVARELLSITSENEQLKLKLEGYVSNANFNRKKGVYIFFINHRLIENSALKKALQAAYANYLPKNTHPFIYLSIEMEPQNVDVNVHPTKKEVHLLQEEKVVEFVQKVIDNRLLGSNSSRTFYTQPGIDVTLGFTSSSSSSASASASSVGAGIPTPIRSVTGGNSREDGAPPAVAPYRLVRTDSRAQKITSFLGSSSSLAADRSHDEEDEGEEGEEGEEGRGQKRSSDALVTLGKKLERRARKRRTTPLLTSVENLCGIFEAKEHRGLKDLFAKHTFVGCVDANFSLLQHQTKLYLINTYALSKEFFYQLTLQQFSDLSRIRLLTPAPVEKLLLLSLECPESGWSKEDGSQEEIAEYITKLLISKKDMLNEYFSLEIAEDGNLHTLPQLLEGGYIPCLDALPLFLLRLGTEVDWTQEQQCFEDIAKELANFYCLSNFPQTSKKSSPSSSTSSQGDEEEGEVEGEGKTSYSSGFDSTSLLWTIQHVFFDALRISFFPPTSFANDGTVIQIACLTNLYKIFERC